MLQKEYNSNTTNGEESKSAHTVRWRHIILMTDRFAANLNLQKYSFHKN